MVLRKLCIEQTPCVVHDVNQMGGRIAVVAKIP